MSSIDREAFALARGPFPVINRTGMQRQQKVARNPFDFHKGISRWVCRGFAIRNEVGWWAGVQLRPR